ncbi:hypothetical protein A2U01_0104175, partial [Trifolium medium]|nr:hypothetical protein [Trifolium medium]
MTLRLCRAATFCLRHASRREAAVRSTSTRSSSSRIALSFSSSDSGWVVRHVSSSTSTGITASV